MRAPAGRLLTVLVTIVVLVAGCGSAVSTQSPPSTAPTPIPASSIPTLAPTFALSPSPAPTPTPAPTAPRDPFVGRAVVTVSDNLRMRSQPWVGDDSIKYEPPLPIGTKLKVLDGPVEGSGYTWYQVEPIDPGWPHAPDYGWVAMAGKDGEPWIALAPLADGWPVMVSGTASTVVGADGTAYAWASAEQEVLLALDATGHLKPGWPFVPLPPWIGRQPVPGSDGSVLVGLQGDGQATYELHRLGPDGREVPGWPYLAESALSCPLPVVDASGTTYLACMPEGPGAPEIVALDPAGRVVPGWPVGLGQGDWLGQSWGSALQVGTDRTIYAAVGPDSGEGAARLWAFAPDGSTRPGWPVTLGSTWVGYLVAPGGRVLVGSYVPPEVPNEGLCSEASKTVLTELDARGRTVAGWPRQVDGYASAAIDGSGTVSVLDEGQHAWAFAPDGSDRGGWPVEIPRVYPGCGNPGPFLAPDGTVFITADGKLLALSRNGRSKSGWPFVPAGGFPQGNCDVDAPFPADPALGPDGRVFVTTYAGDRPADSAGPVEITALGPDGRLIDGWPFRFPDGARGAVTHLEVVGGRLYVATCGGLGGLLALEPDGTLAD